MTFINTINFLGAAAHIDSEAEYRLVSLGRDIIEAKISVNNVSLSLKASYAESVAGDVHASRTHLESSAQNLGRARAAWAKVGKEFSNTAHWLDGYMRPEYCEAFVSVAKHRGEIQAGQPRTGVHDVPGNSGQGVRGDCGQ